MERLTTYKKEVDREMICRHEECDTIEEYCPHCNEENCPCLQEVINKLADYEDAEEQGLLLRLPCKVGDTVYFVHCGKIKEGLVKEVVIRLDTILISIYDIDEKFIYQKDFKNLGHTWFTTKKQAKAKLKEME